MPFSGNCYLAYDGHRLLRFRFLKSFPYKGVVTIKILWGLWLGQGVAAQVTPAPGHLPWVWSLTPFRLSSPRPPRLRCPCSSPASPRGSSRCGETQVEGGHRAHLLHQGPSLPSGISTLSRNVSELSFLPRSAHFSLSRSVLQGGKHFS